MFVRVYVYALYVAAELVCVLRRSVGRHVCVCMYVCTCMHCMLYGPVCVLLCSVLFCSEVHRSLWAYKAPQYKQFTKMSFSELKSIWQAASV